MVTSAWIRVGALSLLILAACGGADSSATNGASVTTISETTTSEAESVTTTTIPATTTTTISTGCPDAELPGDVSLSETTTMDLDLDGIDDEISVYTGNSSERDYGWWVEFGGGGSAILTRPIWAVDKSLVPIGAHDVDGDGNPELVAIEYVIGDGISYEPGSFTEVQFYDLMDCTLSPEPRTDGTDRGFGILVGAYPPQGSQIVCSDGLIEQYDFYLDASGDTTKFSVTKVTWTPTEDGWTLDSELIEVDKDEMMQQPIFTCGDLTLPDARPPT